MTEVLDIAQMRIQLAHQLDDLECRLVAVSAVFYFHTVVYYAFYMPAIFGEGYLFSGGIIVHVSQVFCSGHF